MTLPWEDRPSAVRRAGELYARGAEPRDVLRACHGVDFPEEFLLIAESWTEVLWDLGEFDTLAWILAAPPVRDCPPFYEEEWAAVQEQYPRLLPLGHLYGAQVMERRAPGPSYGEAFLCYDLDELRDGRATVLGLRRGAAGTYRLTRFGDSLVEVLHGHVMDRHAQLDAQLDHSSNRGAGSVDREEVEEAWALVEAVRDLRRALAAREAP